MTAQSTDNLAIIILAAGHGSRMKSDIPKPLHKLAGRPMIGWLMETAQSLQPDQIITIIGPQGTAIADEVKPYETATQSIPQGTGDAVRQAMPLLEGFEGDVLILLADMPLLSSQTLKSLRLAKQDSSGLSVLGARFETPPAFGRLVLDDKGHLEKIVEDKDCSPAEKQINLCNTGAFCVEAARLKDWLPLIGNKNAQKEFYITDLVQIARQNGHFPAVHVLEDHGEIYGVNSRTELADLEKIIQNRLRKKAMAGGATLIDPDSVYFSFDTKTGRDVIIEPNVFFGQGVNIGDGTTIHAFSHIEGAEIGDNVSIGPFARIRPKSKIDEGASVGNFCEINRSHLLAGSKSKHVSYIGDTTVGKKTNIGAGTVVANYDGYEKHKTVMGDNVFIGSNSTIIAPSDIGNGAVVAAGTTLKGAVPKDALGIARPNTEIREGWAAQRRSERTKKQ